MRALDRRIANVAHRLASKSGASWPDPTLVQHRSERMAAAGFPQNVDPSFPTIEPGEAWPDYLARCVAGTGISVAELQAMIAETLETERAIIAFECASGTYT